MAGAKSFGTQRLASTIGNVGITASVEPGVGVSEIQGIDPRQTDLDTNVDEVNSALATAAVLYAGNSEATNELYRLTATISINAIDSATAPAALHTMARAVGLTAQAEWLPAGAAPVDNTNIGAAIGAIVAMPPQQFSASNVGGDNAQASVTIPAAAGVVYVAASIDAAMIIAPGVNQPLVQLELVQIEAGPTETVLWSREFGVGVAVVDALYQQVSISGLAIPAIVNSDLELRFSASSVVGASQSVSLSYYFVSV